MNLNQKRFADEYLIDHNGSRAYQAAYPSVKSAATARASAARLLTNDNVKEYIQSQEEQLHCVTVASAEEVREFLTAGMRGELSEYRMIRGKRVKQKIRLTDRIKCAEMLSKIMGLYDHELISSISRVVVVDDVPDED
jgi:phage terminase small subunit